MLFTDRLKNLFKEILRRLGSNINLKEAIPIVLLALGITIIILFSSLFPSCDSTITLEEALDDLEFSLLEIFPVDLDIYFPTENSETSRNDILYGHQALLMPLTIHLGTNHPEGGWKWYLYARNSNYEVQAPGEAMIKRSELNIGEPVEVEGERVYQDVFVTLWFDREKRIAFGHINLLESLVDRVLAAPEGFIMVGRGEQIGYTMGGNALDITMLDSDVSNGLSSDRSDNSVRFNACPLNYFSRGVQGQINGDEGYYRRHVYATMVESGMWPESDLCNPIDISDENTIWGNWWYSSGPLPEFDEGGDYHYYSFPRGIVVFLKKSKTNFDTYQRNPMPPNNQIEEECPDWEGLYIDYEGITEATDSNVRYVELEPESGDFSSSGILKLKAFSNAEYRDALYTETKYARFSLILAAEHLDDILNLKFYNTLEEAQADVSFTDSIVYVRDMADGTPFELLSG